MLAVASLACPAGSDRRLDVLGVTEEVRRIPLLLQRGETAVVGPERRSDVIGTDQGTELVDILAAGAEGLQILRQPSSPRDVCLRLGRIIPAGEQNRRELVFSVAEGGLISPAARHRARLLLEENDGAGGWHLGEGVDQ